jgi:hypothetical protein
MIYIAHRGNINGPNPENENKPEYLFKAIEEGFHVETDLWLIDNILYLGHDEPQYKIEIDFLKIKDKLFCHCKNVDALYFILKNFNDIECFFHNEDECVLTSKNHIWNYPGTKCTSLSICVMPERVNQKTNDIWFGICSDYVSQLLNRNSDISI